MILRAAIKLWVAEVSQTYLPWDTVGLLCLHAYCVQQTSTLGNCCLLVHWQFWWPSQLPCASRTKGQCTEHCTQNWYCKPSWNMKVGNASRLEAGLHYFSVFHNSREKIANHFEAKALRLYTIAIITARWVPMRQAYWSLAYSECCKTVEGGCSCEELNPVSARSSFIKFISHSDEIH